MKGQRKGQMLPNPSEIDLALTFRREALAFFNDSSDRSVPSGGQDMGEGSVDCQTVATAARLTSSGFQHSLSLHRETLVSDTAGSLLTSGSRVHSNNPPSQAENQSQLVLTTLKGPSVYFPSSLRVKRGIDMVDSDEVGTGDAPTFEGFGSLPEGSEEGRGKRRKNTESHDVQTAKKRAVGDKHPENEGDEDETGDYQPSGDGTERITSGRGAGKKTSRSTSGAGSGKGRGRGRPRGSKNSIPSPTTTVATSAGTSPPAAESIGKKPVRKQPLRKKANANITARVSVPPGIEDASSSRHRLISAPLDPTPAEGSTPNTIVTDQCRLNTPTPSVATEVAALSASGSMGGSPSAAGGSEFGDDTFEDALDAIKQEDIEMGEFATNPSELETLSGRFEGMGMMTRSRMTSATANGVVKEPATLSRSSTFQNVGIGGASTSKVTIN